MKARHGGREVDRGRQEAGCSTGDPRPGGSKPSISGVETAVPVPQGPRSPGTRQAPRREVAELRLHPQALGRRSLEAAHQAARRRAAGPEVVLARRQGIAGHARPGRPKDRQELQRRQVIDLEVEGTVGIASVRSTSGAAARVSARRRLAAGDRMATLAVVGQAYGVELDGAVFGRRGLRSAPHGPVRRCWVRRASWSTLVAVLGRALLDEDAQLGMTHPVERVGARRSSVTVWALT